MSKTGTCAMGGLLMAAGTLMCEWNPGDEVAPFVPEQARIASDDFNACALRPEVWAVTDTTGVATVGVQMTGTADAHASILIPAGGQSAVAGGEVRLLQPVTDGDFDIEVKFDSSIDRPGLRQGLLIQQDSGHVLRYELSGEPNGVVLRSSTVADISSSVRGEGAVAALAPVRLRVQRQADQWTLQYSYADGSWTDHATFAEPLAVSAVGVVAGNQSGDAQPAFEAKVDYFVNAATPFAGGEDASPPPAAVLTRSVSGAGWILVQPDQASYYCAQTVIATARPTPGWVFAGWQGDLNGAQASQILTMAQSRAITAMFVTESSSDGGEPVTPDKPVTPVVTKPRITPVKDHSVLAGSWYQLTMSLTQGTGPVTWSLVEGPSGMTISAADGEVVWPLPQAAGETHSITVKAANSAGEDRSSYRLTVMAVTLIEAGLSAASAPDGTKLLANYHISGPTGLGVQLGCGLIAPDGKRGPDSTGPDVVSLTADDAWYTREFLVNAPPPSAASSYDVEWEVRWLQDGKSTLRSLGALSILQPVPIAVPILMYHYVGEGLRSPYWVSPDRFRDQMRALRAYGYTPMILPEWMQVRSGEIDLPAKPVLITFDDGNHSIYSQAYPILADPSINLKATVFLVTGQMGTGTPPDELLTWEEAIELQNSGVFDMQSHTANHDPVGPLKGEELIAELLTSRLDIEHALGKPARFLSWPYGDLDAEAKRAAWEAGYWAALGAAGGVEPSGEDKWALRRVYIGPNSTLAYDPEHPGTFFLNQIGEPNLVIPSIAVNEVSARDPASPDMVVTTVPRGGAVTMRVIAYNFGQPATVTASLVLDLDAEPGDGSTYDSHALGQDILKDFPNAWEGFEWSWNVPAEASPGRYYARAVFRDAPGVVVWNTSAWVQVFEVPAQ